MKPPEDYTVREQSLWRQSDGCHAQAKELRKQAKRARKVAKEMYELAKGEAYGIDIKAAEMTKKGNAADTEMRRLVREREGRA